MINKKWTKAQEKVLWEMQRQMSAAELGRKFGVTGRQITKKLYEMSLERKKAARKAAKSKKTKAPAAKKPSKPEKRPAKRTNGRPTASNGVASYGKALQLFDRGVELFNRKKFEKARAVFADIMEGFADEQDFHDRARLYLNLIERQMHPSEPRARGYEDFYNRAIYCLNIAEYDKALGFLKKASEKKPNDPSITYFMALVFAGKNDAPSCLPLLKKAIELDAENRVLARNETEFQSLAENPEIRELLFPRRPGGTADAG